MTVQYLFSERAHYMCPNMHFGIAIEICAEYNKALTRRILDELSQAHPLLRSVILEDEQGTFFVFAAHHLLCDGMALLQLVQSFANYYVNLAGSDTASKQQVHTIPASTERIIASADEFPSDSKLNFLTKCIVNSANRNWRKEGKKVSYSEYRSFE